ncbi:MAG: hypothetical protein ACOC85_02085 [Thermoplasmatota archaeon]
MSEGDHVKKKVPDFVSQILTLDPEYTLEKLNDKTLKELVDFKNIEKTIDEYWDSFNALVLLAVRKGLINSEKVHRALKHYSSELADIYFERYPNISEKKAKNKAKFWDKSISSPLGALKYYHKKYGPFDLELHTNEELEAFKERKFTAKEVDQAIEEYERLAEGFNQGKIDKSTAEEFAIDLARQLRQIYTDPSNSRKKEKAYRWISKNPQHALSYIRDYYRD